MDYIKAMNLRVSRRKYRPDPIPGKSIDELSKLVDEINQETGLHLQMVLGHGEAFDGLLKSYGLFSGVQNYLVLAGAKDIPYRYEKMGYYGEKWVLLATSLHIGTCWVAGTYDKKSVRCDLRDNEEIVALIPFGVPVEQETVFAKMLRRGMHRRSKTIEEMLHSPEQPPNWVLEGMKYVVKAPSAVNRQPAKFTSSQGLVMAAVPSDAMMQQLDLGIAKLHFELGAGGGQWQWGSGGMFEHQVSHGQTD